MAGPGQFNYFLTGQDSFFINENDNKIIIRSDAPTVTIDSTGIVRPTTGSLALATAAPLLIGAVVPSTGTLTVNGTQVGQHTVKPTLRTVSLAGAAPSLSFQVSPQVKALSLDGQSAARFTGLWLEGFAPLAKGGTVVSPTVGDCTLSGKVPDVAVDAPASQVRIPQKGGLTLAGAAPVGAGSHIVLPTTAALTAFGRLTFINDVVFPGAGSVAATGFAPIPDSPGGEVIVIISGPFEQGTLIRNLNAGPDAENRYTIDERTGFKVKVRKGYPLAEEWTGIHTVDPDPPEFQLRVQQTKTRYKQGAIRPEPVGNELFIDPDNPVEPDDL